MRIAMSLPADLLDRLGREAERQGHEVIRADADGIAATASAAVPHAVLALAAPNHLSAALLAAADEVGARCVALIDSDSGRRWSRSLGLLETAPVDADWAELESVLAGGGLSEDTAAGDRQAEAAQRGTVIAIWGPTGAPGRTTIAITLAAAIAASGRRVVLADADTHGASVGAALGIPDEVPGFAAACRLAGTDALTADELDRIASEVPARAGAFRVLTGIGRPSRWPELGERKVTRALKVCRDWADVVLVDAGFGLETDEELASDLLAPRRHGATLAALRSADHVVAVGAADPIGVARLLRAHLDLAETVPSERVTVVMNGVRASAIGLAPHGQLVAALERFGGITAPVLVPHDLAGTDAALLSGRTLQDAAPRSPILPAVVGLSRRLLPEAVPDGAARRRSRLLRPRARLAEAV